MKTKKYKTMQIWIKKGHCVHSYFQEMCSNSKNLYNTTNFYIRQIFTALTQESQLQPSTRSVRQHSKTLAENERSSAFGLSKEGSNRKKQAYRKTKRNQI